eukprot:364829-Chlamydomonas_euryale.AAC.11
MEGVHEGLRHGIRNQATACTAATGAHPIKRHGPGMIIHPSRVVCPPVRRMLLSILPHSSACLV